MFNYLKFVEHYECYEWVAPNLFTFIVYIEVAMNLLFGESLKKSADICFRFRFCYQPGGWEPFPELIDHHNCQKKILILGGMVGAVYADGSRVEGTEDFPLEIRHNTCQKFSRMYKV